MSSTPDPRDWDDEQIDALLAVWERGQQPRFWPPGKEPSVSPEVVA